MRRLGGRLCGVLALVTGIVALLLVAGAGASNPQSYSDPVDTDPGPDVTSVTFSSDRSGVVSMRMELANRPTGLTAGDNIYVYVNTDRNTATGCAGSEYRIYAFGSPLQFGVDPCVAGSFTEAGACCGSFSNGGLSFTIPPDRLGGSTNFWFWVATAVNGNFGPPAGDFVPDADPSGSPLQYDGGMYLDVSKSGSGAGTVSSSPEGITCGSTCSANFATGASVTLTADAAPGSVFSGWSGDCSGTGACTLTMSANHRVTATFGPAPPKTKRMRPAVVILKNNLLTSANRTWWRAFWIGGLPSGARVVFHCCKRSEVAHANAAGKAHSRIVSGHKFHRGDLIKASLSHPGYFSCVLQVRVLVGDYRASTSGRCSTTDVVTDRRGH